MGYRRNAASDVSGSRRLCSVRNPGAGGLCRGRAKGVYCNRRKRRADHRTGRRAAVSGHFQTRRGAGRGASQRAASASGRPGSGNRCLDDRRAAPYHKISSERELYPAGAGRAGGLQSGGGSHLHPGRYGKAPVCDDEKHQNTDGDYQNRFCHRRGTARGRAGNYRHGREGDREMGVHRGAAQNQQASSGRVHPDGDYRAGRVRHGRERKVHSDGYGRNPESGDEGSALGG